MRPPSRFRRFAVVVVVTLVLIGSVPASTVVDAAPSQATSGERSPGSIGPPKVGSSSADVRTIPAFDPPGERVGTASLDALETHSGDGPRLSFDDGDLRDREDAVLGTASSDSADTLAPDLEPVPGGEAITEVGMSIDHEDDHHDDGEDDHHEEDEDDHHDDGENDHHEDDFDFETNDDDDEDDHHDDDEDDHHDDGENDHHEDDFDFETNDDDDEDDHHEEDEDDHHEEDEDEDRSGSSDTDSGGTDGSAAATSVFQGQSVRLTGLASNTVVPVQRVSPAASAGTVGRIRTDENGRATVPTDELPAGTYLVEGPRSDESFSVVEQTLTVGGDTVVNSTGPGVAGKFVLTSNRRGSFPMQVTATRNGERVSAELIAEVFEDSTGMPIREVSDDTVRVTVVGAREGAALIGDFDSAEAGEYRFQFYVPDTATLAEEPIRVRGGPPRAALAAETVAVDRGDVARIPVGITGRTDSALLRIGGEASGYRATVSVEDGDGDGRVLVEFDTRAAGATGTATTVARAADANDTVTLLDQTASETAPAPGGYWIRAGIRTADSGISRTDTGMLSIGSRATTGIRVWRAPGSVEPDVDGDGAVGRTDLAAMADSGRLSRADTVATTDLAVVRVEATGLESLAGNRSAFEESLDEDLALVISPEEGDADPDAAGGAVRIDGDDVSADGPLTLVPAPEQGDYFVVIDLARAGFVTNGTTGDGRMRPGSAYTVTFAVTDDRLRPPNGDGPRPVRAAFELAGPVAVFEEETMTVGPSTDRTVRGVSSLAPGTELAVSVEPVTGSGPAAERRKTVVGEDGRFNVSVGFDASAAGDTFAVTASKGSTELGSARIRVVSESATPTPTPTVSSRQEASGTVEEGTTPTESAGAGRTESTVTAAPETGSGKPTAGTANRGLEILPGRGTGLSGPDIARVTSLGLGVAVFVVVGYRRWT